MSDKSKLLLLVLLSGGGEPSAIANKLVYDYKDHGFVIDKEEAVSIFGDKTVKCNTAASSLGVLYKVGSDFFIQTPPKFQTTSKQIECSKDVGRMCGCSDKSISQIENGQATSFFQLLRRQWPTGLKSTIVKWQSGLMFTQIHINFVKIMYRKLSFA